METPELAEIFMIITLSISLISSSISIIIIEQFPKPLAIIQIVIRRIFSYDILSSIIHLISIIVNLTITTESNQEEICKIFSSLSQFSTNGLVINCYLQSFYSYQGLIKNSLQHDSKILIVSLIVQVGLCIYPLIQMEFKRTGRLCLEPDYVYNGDLISKAVVLVLFYLPVLICFLLSIYYLRKSYKIILSTKNVSVNSQLDYNLSKRIIRNMAFQPLIFFICWIGFGICRFINLLDEDNNGDENDKQQFYITACINYLQGFFLTIQFVHLLKSSQIYEENFIESRQQRGSTQFSVSSNDTGSFNLLEPILE